MSPLRLVLVVILLLGCLSGCARRDDYTFTLNPASSQEDIVAAETAADEWNLCNVVRAEVVVRAPQGDDVPITRFDMLVKNGHVVNGETKVTLGQPQWVHYMPTTDPTQVFAHEFGHAFGLKHSDVGIMVPGFAEDGHVVGPIDCEALRQNRGL